MADTDTSFFDEFRSYVTTRKGIILMTEMVLCLFVIIFYAASFYTAYSSIGIFEMVMAIVFFVIFMFELDKKYANISWLWSDLFRTITGAAVLTIMCLASLIKWSGDGAWVAAGITGIVAGVVFAYDAYTVFLQVQSSKHNTAASTDASVFMN